MPGFIWSLAHNGNLLHRSGHHPEPCLGGRLTKTGLSRFCCHSCVPFPNANGNPGQCRFGYNWWAMVRFHGLNIAKKSKIDNKFCVGNSSSSQRRRPQPEFQDYDSFRSRSSRDEEKREKQRKMASRSVDMCPEHLDKLQKREVVEQHLLERYVISPLIPIIIFSHIH